MRRLMILGLAVAATVATGRADERAAAPGFFDLAVPGGARQYEALGLSLEERGQALALIARRAFVLGANVAERLAARRRPASAPDDRTAASAGLKSRPPSAQAPGDRTCYRRNSLARRR